MRKTAAKLLAVAAIATSVATIASGTALADPTVTPAAQDIVGTGSDTTQTVLNDLSSGYNAYLTGIGNTTSPRLYSWDSTGTSPITPKTGAATITRPNGSGAGITALNANTNATVDFARSSRGPQTGDPVTDIFVAFAKDAVSWAGKTGGNAPANLTTAQLKGIYECTTTNWTQINAALPNATIKPHLPQVNSGTRSFFLKAIGVTTPGSCVTTGTQENQGTDPVLNDPNTVVPYSVAHYIGQVYFGHASGSDAPGALDIRSINGIAPVNTVAKTINSSFASTSYGRVVYNVVREADWTATTTQGTALRAIFGTTGWICTSGGPTIKSHGFLQLPGAACGSTTHI
ncbi:PstS family phosphate ABC transporter substrate-binding protein [Kitasatospora sp. NPDC054939]